MKTLAISLALIAAATQCPWDAGSTHVTGPESSRSYYCVYPKTVSVGDHAIQTPTICVPAP
jgi:hypothetical protein